MTELKRLTVKELKGMAGEWVWIEAHDRTNGKYHGWGYLPKHGNDDAVLITEFNGFWEGSPVFTLSFSFKDYGKFWNAYLQRKMRCKE